MVTISTRGYNVAKVGVNGVIDVDTPTNVGTKKDFSAIVDFAKTGYLILRTKFKKNGQTFMFDGSVDCEIQEDGSVFFSTLTEENDGEDVTIQTLTGTFSVSGANCVMAISEAEVGGGGTAGDDYVEVGSEEHTTIIGTLLDSLYAAMDTSKITKDSRLVAKMINGSTVFSSVAKVVRLMTSPNINAFTFASIEDALNSSSQTIVVENIFKISNIGGKVISSRLSADGVSITDVTGSLAYHTLTLYY